MMNCAAVTATGIRNILAIAPLHNAVWSGHGSRNRGCGNSTSWAFRSAFVYFVSCARAPTIFRFETSCCIVPEFGRNIVRVPISARAQERLIESGRPWSIEFTFNFPVTCMTKCLGHSTGFSHQLIFAMYSIPWVFIASTMLLPFVIATRIFFFIFQLLRTLINVLDLFSMSGKRCALPIFINLCNELMTVLVYFTWKLNQSVTQ